MGRLVSNGRSVRVAVPVSTTIVGGNFYLLDGFLGMADFSIITDSEGKVTSIKGQTVTGLAGLAGIAAEVVLKIDIGEYETSQIDTSDSFAKGDKVYYDETNHRFTTVATDGKFCGVVTVAKDSGNVIWFIFIPSLDDTALIDGLTATVTELNVLHEMTASTAELNKLDGVGTTLASGTQHAHVVDLKVDYTTGDLDLEAEIIAAVNATNTAVNAILAALEAFKINAAGA